MSQFYQTINIENNEANFKIHAIFQEESLNLTIFDDSTAWSYNVLKTNLAKLSESLKADLNEYYDNLKNYLESRPDNVTFAFEEGEFTIHLALQNRMKIIYFQCSLEKVNFTLTLFNLLEQLYKGYVANGKDANEIKKKHDILYRDYEIMERKMNEFLERRELEEKKWFNNFIGILNEKKRQIQHLYDLLIAFRQGRSTVNPPTAGNKRKKKNEPNKKRVEIESKPALSDSESNYSIDSYDTDDEPKTSKGLNNPLPVPSTSKVFDDYRANSPPQSFSFPKRISSQNKFEHSISMKIDSKEDKIVNSIEFADNHGDNGIKKATVDFNTQDLLDSI